MEECLKVTLLHGCFSRFLNCAHGTKSYKAPHYKRNYQNETGESKLRLLSLSICESIKIMDIIKKCIG